MDTHVGSLKSWFHDRLRLWSLEGSVRQDKRVIACELLLLLSSCPLSSIVLLAGFDLTLFQLRLSTRKLWLFRTNVTTFSRELLVAQMFEFTKDKDSSADVYLVYLPIYPKTLVKLETPS